MTRLTRTIIFGSFIFVPYILIWTSTLPVPFIDEKVKNELLAVFPWWLLVSFGSYSLWSLGKGLFTFNDVPEAYEELMKEISEAKNDLRAKGVSVD